MRKGLIVCVAMLLLGACNQSGRWDSHPYTTSTTKPVPGTYVVVPGDTVSEIAERTNSAVLTIIELNHLEPPFIIRPGQVLRISGETFPDAAPSGVVGVKKLPPLQGSKAAAPKPVSSSSYNPQPKPYTTAISTPSPKPLVSSEASPSQQSLPSATKPLVNSKVEEPKVTPKNVPSLEASTISNSNAAPKIATEPPKVSSDSSNPAVPGKASQISKESKPSVVPAPEAEMEPSSAPIQKASTPSAVSSSPSILPPVASEQFLWPVSGPVISKFGPDKDGLKNDGINISAPSGTPVKAVAEGEVAYAGNELRGFGNLILLRHANGWISAYAHNESLTVKKGDKVRQGQVIAKVGQSGNVSQPQLHFELRKGAQAVDPIPHFARS